LRGVVPGWIDEAAIATGAAALRVAEDHGLPAPRLIASDLNGVRTGGVAVTLETALPGSSALPPQVSARRLNEAGAAIARVHAIPLQPQQHLPLRTRPTQVDDRARERRWSTLYAATEEAGRPAVLDALRELTGWPESRALGVLTAPCSTPLLQLADDRIRDYDRPRTPSVFLHGDIWGGNMLWDGDNCLALIDWKTAGAGSPGVDLGELRLQMALQYGPEAPQHVLAGWEYQSGQQATDTPYWDIVAALNTPVILDGWPGFDTDGGVLPVTAVTGRRDEFLSTALNQL
jgi:aminoglycoside phosphotransferase (APT) family kinase protein